MKKFLLGTVALVALGATDKGEEKLEETIFHPTDGSWIGKFPIRCLWPMRKQRRRYLLLHHTRFIEQQLDHRLSGQRAGL